MTRILMEVSRTVTGQVIWWFGGAITPEFGGFCDAAIWGSWGSVIGDRVRMLAACDWLRDHDYEITTCRRQLAFPSPGPNPLDVLVKACTAMQTWGELEESMDNGYVPTIYPDSRRKRQLIAALRHHGYAVWTGTNKSPI